MLDNHACGWFALQTVSGKEGAVAVILEGKAYEVFLPLYERRRQWADRVKKVLKPLFPGYLFCRVGPEARGRIVTTPGVIRIVGFGNSPARIDDEEVEAIRRITESGLPAEPCPPLREGERVRIEQGPLQGLEGTFVRSGSQHQLVVTVRLLQRAVAVGVDRDWVRSCEDEVSDEPRLTAEWSPLS